MESKHWLIEGIVKFAAVIVNYFEIVLLGNVVPSLRVGCSAQDKVRPVEQNIKEV